MTKQKILLRRYGVEKLWDAKDEDMLKKRGWEKVAAEKGEKSPQKDK